MKKILIITLVLFLGLSGSMFAQNKGWAIGGAFYLSWTETALPTGAALCFKFPSVPIMFGVSASLIDPVAIGVTADWWLFMTHLVGPVSLYIGPGAFLVINTAPNAPIDFGLRVPIGFQIFIVPAFEIFLEPAVAVHALPRIPTFGIQASIGFRFWF